MNTATDFAVLSSLETLESEFKQKHSELLSKLSVAGRAYYDQNNGRHKKGNNSAAARKQRANPDELNSSLLAIQDALRKHYAKHGEGATKREVAAMIPDLEFNTIDSYMTIHAGKLWKLVGTKQLPGQRGPASNIYVVIEAKEPTQGTAV